MSPLTTESLSGDRPDYIEPYKDAAGEWRWRRIDGWNGNVKSDSGEGYVRKVDCLEAAQSVNPGIEIRTEEE